MTQIYLARNPANAYILKGILESNGLACEVQGDQLYHLLGELPLSQETTPSVWIVDDTQYDRAMQIVEEYKTTELSEASDEPTWVCHVCGESGYEPFTECWKCGTPRKP